MPAIWPRIAMAKRGPSMEGYRSLTADATYAEFNFALRAHDHLTFISDGVLEAMNKNKELFGFERTQAISGQSAKAIAHAAKDFGQEDDITVLTVSRLSVFSKAISMES